MQVQRKSSQVLDLCFLIYCMHRFLRKLLLCIPIKWQNRKTLTPQGEGEQAAEQLRRRICKKLAGFSAEGASSIDIWEMVAGGRDPLEDLPVPPLILFTLHRLLGYPCLDPGDKGRWAVGCMVDGEPVVFRDRKFGFEILFAPNSKLTWSRVVRPMKAALRVLEEDLLEPLAKEQIHKGQVALINRYGEFSSRYQYFRSNADEQFALAEVRPQDRPADHAEGLEGFASISAVVAEMNRAATAEREGFFLSAAMVDTYFSLLEHRLILLRAFTGKPMATGDFESLLGGNWEAKLISVLNLNSKGADGKPCSGSCAESRSGSAIPSPTAEWRTIAVRSTYRSPGSGHCRRISRDTRIVCASISDRSWRRITATCAGSSTASI